MASRQRREAVDPVLLGRPPSSGPGPTSSAFAGARTCGSVGAAIAAERALPERVIGALADAAYGFRLRNATYRDLVRIAAEEISELTASRDLKLLVSQGLLSPIGQTRARQYVGTEEVRAVWQAVHRAHAEESAPDPFGTDSEPEVMPGQLTLSSFSED